MLRAFMSAQCAERWGTVGRGIDFVPLNPLLLQKTDRQFQRYRRIVADGYSHSDPYIVTDDDCLLSEDFSLKECLRIFKEHPEFGIISLLPSNAHIQEWTPENYTVCSDSDVMEVASVGGIRFCRKDILKDWPPMGEGPGYDAIHAAAIHMAGFRVGYFRNQTMNHLGERHSTVWPAHRVTVQ